jgi:Protein of unknown function (DUF1501)
MLRILGSPQRLCDGVRRRDFLRAGAFGLAGLSLPQLLQAADSSFRTNHEKSFGKAKSCILLYLYGSPSQLETFDMKPDAPLEIRGEMKPIASAIPGYRVCELLPETAKVLDGCTVVRSMTHPYPIHGIAYATTGIDDPQGSREVDPRHPDHWPFIGSAVDYLDEQRAKGRRPELPRNLALPFPLSTRRSNQPFRAGPYGGFLGTAYDPIWTEFRGKGTKAFAQSNRGVVKTFYDPYGGIKPDGRFELSSSAKLREEITLDRLSRRRSLLRQFDVARKAFDAGTREDGFDRFQGMAFDLLTSSKLRKALDVAAEPMSLREKYGMSLYGQGAVVARRLVEAGARMVSLFWDEYGLADSAWDTHYQHYRRLKAELCPSFDLAYSGLIRDLEDRGLLDETLVVCISEHGRTPKIDSKAAGAGRHHWSRAYSAIFAGGGFGKGQIIGKTDAIAGDVVSNPVSPKDILATVYHLLGIDPHTLITDKLGRPLPVAGKGTVRRELLA